MPCSQNMSGPAYRPEPPQVYHGAVPQSNPQGGQWYPNSHSGAYAHGSYPHSGLQHLSSNVTYNGYVTTDVPQVYPGVNQGSQSSQRPQPSHAQTPYPGFSHYTNYQMEGHQYPQLLEAPPYSQYSNMSRSTPNFSGNDNSQAQFSEQRSAHGTQPPHLASRYVSRSGSVISTNCLANPNVEQQSCPDMAEKQVIDDLQWAEPSYSHEESEPQSIPSQFTLPATLDGAIVPYTPGNSVSRYITSDNLEQFMGSIKDNSVWSTMKYDPAFAAIIYDAPLVPLEDIDAWMAERRGEDERPETVVTKEKRMPASYGSSRKRARSEDAESEQCDMTTDHQDDGNTESLRHSGITSVVQPRYRRSSTPMSTRAKTPTFSRAGTPAFDKASSQSAETTDNAWQLSSREGTTETDPTEALLASLGVTGTPKPVRPFGKEHPKNKLQGFEQVGQVWPGHAAVQNREDSGYSSARASYSSGSRSGFEHMDSLPSHLQAQPPPPPPSYMRRRIENSVESPLSSESGPEFLTRPGYDGADNHVHVSKRQQSSPLTPISAEMLGYEVQPVEEGKKPGPLRQIDDVTPKLRRRQPQVADAYR